LPLQLRWRSTARVRWILAAYCCLAPAVLSLPVEAAFQVQESLAHGDGGARLPAQIDQSQRITFSRPDDRIPASLRGISRFVTLTVPLIVPDLPDKAPWQIDYASIRVVGGTIDQTMGFAAVFFVPRQQPGVSPAKSSGNLSLNIPIDLFQSAQEQHAKIEATLYSTTFRLIARKPVRSLSGTGIDTFSLCHERSDQSYGTVECLSTRPVGTCMRVDGGKQGNRMAQPNLFTCRQVSYAPWPIPLWRDPYYQAEVNGSWEVSESGIYIEPDKTKDTSVVSNYVPDAHFTQQIGFGIDGAVEGSSHRARESVDGVGAAVRFRSPSAIATDRHGNIYIADLDHVIRKVTPSGEVTTFAGHASQPGADDGRGADARFQEPRGIAVDSTDNVYVADTGNHLIRKISPDGMVSTLAGRTDASSTPGAWVMRRPTEIVAVTDGTLYVIDYDKSNEAVLLKISPAGAISKLAGPDTE
jgi:NHL repeat